MLCKVDNKKLKNNVKESKKGNERNENESINRALKDNVINVRELKEECRKAKNY